MGIVSLTDAMSTKAARKSAAKVEEPAPPVESDDPLDADTRIYQAIFDGVLNHRLTPYIDRIVLAIDPKAEARVRDLTARLSALPIRLTLLIDPKTAEQRNAAERG